MTSAGGYDVDRAVPLLAVVLPLGVGLANDFPGKVRVGVRVGVRVRSG